MRRKARTDDNQQKIVAALRRVGASVTPTHAVGKGFPDLVVGFRNRNYLFEVKDGAKKPSERKLTDDEKEWFDRWMGEAHVVENEQDAIKILLANNNTP